MAELIFNLILRGALLAADIASGGKPKDLVGTGGGTGVPGLCILHVIAGNSDDNRYATVDCNGDINKYSLSDWSNGGTNKISDSRIGDISVNFIEETHPENNAPWPGGPAVDSDVYSQSSGGSTSSVVGMSTLAPTTGPKEIVGKGCDGEDVAIIVGYYDWANVDDDSDDYWEEYSIVFPLKGGNPGCTKDSKRGVEWKA
ncbi:hypothetical protein F4777DRAFT_546752 [Nemania sp. FL0916]|nr:hypothetical protein F4777DRAFT_546752 [Nemania sp. FL0916]